MKIFQRCDKEKETTITPFDLFYFLDLESLRSSVESSNPSLETSQSQRDNL